jgi:hypothetical protein
MTVPLILAPSPPSEGSFMSRWRDFHGKPFPTAQLLSMVFEHT